jgi:AcrR family transcriptional regulator
MDGVDKSPNRLERRKQRTRAALIKAAQGFISAGKLNVPVQDLSQAADVGVGSFYNHFESKEELFQAAVNEVLDAQGVLLDALTDSVEDPAEKFASRFRLTGRLVRVRPQESRVVLAVGVALITSERGLGLRGKRDIGAAAEAGRFQVADVELATVLAGGALLGLAKLLHDQPERDDAETTDQVAESLLRLFGMSAEDAHQICQVPLPDLSPIRDVGPVAQGVDLGPTGIALSTLGIAPNVS